MSGTNSNMTRGDWSAAGVTFVMFGLFWIFDNPMAASGVLFGCGFTLAVQELLD